WSVIVSFFKFIKKHWKRIIFEVLRLLGVAGGVVLIYFGYVLPEFDYFIWIGIPVIIISETLTRKSVLVFFKKTIIAIGKFVKRLFISLWNKTKEIIKRTLDRLSIFFFNLWQFFKKHYVRILLESGRLILAVGGGYLIYYGFLEVSFWYFTYIGIGIIVLFEIILRKAVLRKLYEVLKAIGRFFRNLGIFFWNLLLLLYEPFKFIGLRIYELIKFLIRHWVKVILYTFDVVAIGSIATTIYFTFSLQFYWWYIVILSASGAYLIIHHTRSIWKVIKFVFVDIFYGIIKEIYLLNKRFFTAIGRFFKKHWKSIVKELVRLVFVAGGILLIYFGYGFEPAIIGTAMVWSGIAIIPISALFSRVAVLRFIWQSIKRFFVNLKNIIVGAYHLLIDLFKEFGRFIKKYSVRILRILGLVSVIYGVTVSFSIGWEELLTILTISIGGFCLIFADFIIHPVKFWKMIKQIPKRIKQVFKTIWLSIKYSVTYIGSNFLRIVLLLTMLFALIYGITLITSFNFLPIFVDDPYVTRLSVGGGLVIVAVGAFILLRREIKKLRTGQSKKWLVEVKEVWKR
ncbi:MAG: hypothetical protein KAS47_05365, partial [Candidatus Heimdallarchaeota archaeon]|nr:hypothetical protein [Candidatus Heimdallarchaeota archaeon]